MLLQPKQRIRAVSAGNWWQIVPDVAFSKQVERARQEADGCQQADCRHNRHTHRPGTRWHVVSRCVTWVVWRRPEWVVTLGGLGGTLHELLVDPVVGPLHPVSQGGRGLPVIL